MSDIGKARQIILNVTHELVKLGHHDLAGQLQNVVGQMMYRRKAARRMPVHSHPITPEIKQTVLDLLENTDLHSSEIATKVNVNPGRVSEILHGDK